MPRGTRQLPGECLRRLAAADLILHAGDFVTAEIYRQLSEFGPLEAVHGNMDDEELGRILPARRIVDVEEARIGIVHEPANLAGLEGCHALVYGHTHAPVVSRDGKTWLLNPGSPTERRRAPTHSMLILTVDGKRIRPKLLELA